MASIEIETNTMENSELSYDLKIPKERIAVVIGKDGETKKVIEDFASVKLNINSEEGDIFIRGSDALRLFDAKEVIRAIGRGFNPDIALTLLKGDYALEIISLKDLVKSKNHLLRLKGRMIGTQGKTRRIIEELTMCHVSVYGKTVGILGRAEHIGIAKQAIDMIIEGSPHASVYKFLEKKRKSVRTTDYDNASYDVKDKYNKFT